jgi:hypothetical protein
MRSFTKIKNNRKGMFSDMQMAVLALVAILIFAVLLANAYTNLKNKMLTQSCKDSIEAHSIISGATGREIFTDIKCPTNEITIKSLKNANKIIAEDMHRCWYIWDKGKGEYFEDEGTFCHICSIYQFADKGKEVDGLFSYLSRESIQVKYPGDNPGTVYADYLSGTQTPMARENINRNIEAVTEIDKLDTSQKYATIFIYTSEKTFMQDLMEGGGRSTVGATGFFGVVGGVGAVLLIGTPVGWIAGGTVAILGAAGVIESFNVENAQIIQFIAFRPYNSNELDALGCQYVEVGQQSNSIR